MGWVLAEQLRKEKVQGISLVLGAAMGWERCPFSATSNPCRDSPSGIYRSLALEMVNFSLGRLEALGTSGAESKFHTNEMLTLQPLRLGFPF